MSDRLPSLDPSTDTPQEEPLTVAGKGASSASVDRLRRSQATSKQEVNSALAEEEVARARAWATCMVILPSIAVVFSPWMPGLPMIKVGFVVSALSYAGAAGLVYWWIRDPRRYTAGVFRLWGYSSVAMTVPLQYCLGAFSPTPLIVTLGLSFFGYGRDNRHSVLISGTAIILYLAMSLLITGGVVPDLGMLSSEGAPIVMLAFFSVMVPLVFVFGLFFSRVSHRALVKAVTQAMVAQRLAGEREGQLFEAERDLEAALNAGAGREGRYSGFSAGPYKLGAVIGRGAMGEVYAASHVNDGSGAAVKLVRFDVEERQGEERLRRFLREGEIGVNLDVPNVVRVYEVGQLTHDVPYLAMELLIGDDLRAVLRRERKMALATCVECCAHVSAGLDAAHRAGIVHRDIKPQNIFRHRAATDPAPTWKVLDFGVSTLIGGTGTLTQGAIIGTPAYMAPEQARSEEVDHRCDVYSLGAVLYRALTGVAPFWGSSTPAKILYDVECRVPTRPSRVTEGLPVAVDSVLAIALAKSRDDRFDSAIDFSDAFTQAAEGQLSEALEARAANIISRYPWGSHLRPDWSQGDSDSEPRVFDSGGTISRPMVSTVLEFAAHKAPDRSGDEKHED